LNANGKKYKQHYHLKDVQICKTALKKVKLLDLDYIKKMLSFVMEVKMNLMAFKIDRILMVLAVFEYVTEIFGLLINMSINWFAPYSARSIFPHIHSSSKE